jgi:hypothetical protein
LLALQLEAQRLFEANPGDAATLIQTTRATAPDGSHVAEFASWIVVANIILNLDEFLTRN